MERRYLNSALAIEERADGTSAIVGYAARFHDPSDPGTEFRLSPNMVERIAPTAFTDAVKSDDVRALFNHDPNVVLGRSKSGTLKLSVDSRGLKYEITAPTTQAGRDVMESIKRGDIDGASFAFTPIKAPVTRSSDGGYVRSLEQVTLADISVVTYAAYQSATSSVRSEDCEQALKDLEAAEAESVAVRLRVLDVLESA